jgi:uncharacterized protein
MEPLDPLIKHAEFIANIFDRTVAGIPILDGPEGDRDLDSLCGYPAVVRPEQYMQMYRRNEIANRIVNLEPDECWKYHPKIYETEEERETPFEKAIDKFIANSRLFAYLHRLDRVSGIGRFGALFLGFDDGQEFDTPAPGYTDSGPTASPGTSQVMYMRVFSETSMTISEFERDPFNPRYGQPKYYNLLFQDSSSESDVAASNRRVHWSRVIHVFDNPIESEVYGQPRQEPVYNRLMDLRKVVGGAGEMFWKGAFPGLAFEVDPKVGEFTEDEKQTLREDVRAYAEGLQRYITMVGVKVNSIVPQVSDPTNHTNNILKLIAMNKGIPIQTFMGTQQGNLDSPQDAITWRERIALRKERHVTPNIIVPTIDRLIQAGVLPVPTEQIDQPLPYIVKWEPMAPLSIIEQAEVAKAYAEALARYSTAGVEALMPFPEFLGKVMGFSAQMVEAVMAAEMTSRSVVLNQLEGMTGTTGGNAPSSIPKVPKPGNKKDPSKTPVNVQQPAG